jgi:uncharacterized protein YwqG
VTRSGSSSEAVCFRALFPPKQNGAGLTYFGGRPRLPPDVPWPTLTRRGREFALSFIGQVDLADVAAVARFADLPQTGVLYFFLDTCIIGEDALVDASLERGPPWRVLYANAGSEAQEQTAAPSNLMTYFGHPYLGPPNELKWTDQIPWRERFYSFEAPRIPMQPARAESILIGRGSNANDERRQMAAWRAAFGELVPYTQFPESWSSGRHELWLPSLSFPATNIYLEILGGGLLKELIGPWPGPDKKLQAVGTEFVPEIRALLANIRPDNLFDKAKSEQRDKLLSILRDCRARDVNVVHALNKLLRQASRWGTVLSVGHSPEAARSVPNELVEMERNSFSPLWYNADNPKRISATRHQMLGYGTEIQGQVEEHLGSHMMLMQFETDPSFGWMFGDCGVLQFWIVPDDLAARRFDKVVATVE